VCFWFSYWGEVACELARWYVSVMLGGKKSRG
jgi:hypothetical protein